MAIVVGIDPGNGGAIAIYDSVKRDVVGDIMDMPIWYQSMGTTKRKQRDGSYKSIQRKRARIDGYALAEVFERFEMLGVELITMEAVGGRTGESGSGSFQFGYGVGMLYMASLYTGIPLETVPPQAWKQKLNVPGKAKADDTAILQRASEILPNCVAQFRGPKGGAKVDRAEAALIAKYGADFVLPTVDLSGDREAAVINSMTNADTGA